MIASLDSLRLPGFGFHAAASRRMRNAARHSDKRGINSELLPVTVWCAGVAVMAVVSGQSD